MDREEVAILVIFTVAMVIAALNIDHFFVIQ